MQARPVETASATHVWNGGDAVATHFFNALSFLFPRGERFFVEQAREFGGDDPAVRDFGAQEAIHAHQHAQYNAVLAAQGYDNVADELARKLEERAYRLFSPLTRLAVVCAYASLAQWARGAHFVSHSLWAAWLSLALSWALLRVAEWAGAHLSGSW